jgi:hypothetical protein
MDHGQALAMKASERYLLGEMSEYERFDFESHYFVCETCAEDVRTGVVLARAIKAVCDDDETASSKKGKPEKSSHKRGWFDWLSPSVFAPTATAAALAVVVGYQAFVVIPPMRAVAEPQAQEAVTLHAETRGEPPVVSVDQGSGLSILTIDVNMGEPGQKITYELLRPSGATVKTGMARVPSAGSQLLFPIPTALLRPEGVWTLILHPPAGTESATERYPFKIVIK